MDNQWAVTASGLAKRFGDRRVVDGVDIAVPTGAVYGVLGPNGAGKTTTLRMLLGIIEPDEGQRSLLGHAHPRDASDLVGYLPEERGLYPAMKARDAIVFMGALRGLDRATGRVRADELLEQAGLGHAADSKIRKLSKGMAQLVQLLGSVVHRPKLLVLDEPFSGLDPVNQERLEALILGERDRGRPSCSPPMSWPMPSGCATGWRSSPGTSSVRGDGARCAGHADRPSALSAARPGAGAARAVARRCGARRRGLAFPDARTGNRADIGPPADGGAGILNLSIERPSLHEAFVRIVGEQEMAA
ncbi:hypothetical protein GCM10020258_25620 [Sphingomonas yabuuchiae]